MPRIPNLHDLLFKIDQDLLQYLLTNFIVLIARQTMVQSSKMTGNAKQEGSSAKSANDPTAKYPSLCPRMACGDTEADSPDSMEAQSAQTRTAHPSPNVRNVETAHPPDETADSYFCGTSTTTAVGSPSTPVFDTSEIKLTEENLERQLDALATSDPAGEEDIDQSRRYEVSIEGWAASAVTSIHADTKMTIDQKIGLIPELTLSEPYHTASDKASTPRAIPNPGHNGKADGNVRQNTWDRPSVDGVGDSMRNMTPVRCSLYGKCAH